MWENLKAFLVFLGEVLKVGLISLLIILPIRYFLVQPFYVKGASMEPNYYDHDYLLIDEISFRWRGPERGEAVVLRYPRDRSQFFIKRIVGLPGERVVVKNEKVWIAAPRGELAPLAEPYLGEWVRTQGNLDITLQADQYFILGDNRAASLDSRAFGPVVKGELVGRSWIRAWPFDRWTVFSPTPPAP